MIQSLMLSFEFLNFRCTQKYCHFLKHYANMSVIYSNTIVLDRSNNNSSKRLLELFHYPSDELESHLHCQKCNHPPSTVLHDGNGHYKHYVRINCNQCNQSRILCRLCPCGEQYNFTPVNLSRNRQRGIDELKCQMDSHNFTHHSSSLNEEDQSFVHNETLSLEHPQDNQMTIPDMIAEAFPVVDDRNKSEFHALVRQCLIEKHTTQHYPEFIVKKYWMRNEECSTNQEDVLTFLRLVRLLSKSSRDQNLELSKVMIGILKQCDDKYNRLFKQMEEIKTLLNEVLNVIQVFNDLFRIHDINQTIIDVESLKSRILKCLHPEDSNSNDVNINNTDKEVTINVPFPIQEKDMRMVLERKYSFMQNIPSPPVHLHPSGYAYVLPSDILRLSVSAGTDIEVIPSGTDISSHQLHARSIYHFPAIQKIVADIDSSTESIVIIYGMWSDGCYCGTESKGRRNTAKMITIHIAHPKMKKSHVYPIALGRSKDDDDSVVRILLQDMSRLKNNNVKCFVPALNKTVNVAFRLGYVIQDRPENADTSGYMSSGGYHSKQFGFSCPIEVRKNYFTLDSGDGLNNDSSTNCTLLKQLSSCKECLNKRIDSFCNDNLNLASASSTTCPSCYDWCLSSVRYLPPNHFPIDVVPDTEKEDEALKSKVISFDSMKEACYTIFQKIYLKEWTKTQAIDFSKRECIKGSIVDKVYKHARALRGDRANDDMTVPELPDSLLPPFWSQDVIAMDNFLLGIMHYLFLNVGSHVLFCVKDKLADDNMWTSTATAWNNILDGVRSLSLSWCKTWTLVNTDKPASMWVSENYLGFSIVAKSLATSIDGIESGCLYEYRRLIEDTMMCYSAIVNVVMSPNHPTDDNLNRVDALVKMFLSFMEDLDNCIVKESNNKIQTASCFANLLALKKKMQRFGVVRNFWEGGIRGEGIFLPLKESINRGFHTSGICERVLNSQYKSQSLSDLIQYQEHLINQGSTGNGNNDPFFDKERYRRFYSYSNQEEVIDSTRARKPISLVWYVPSKKFYTIIGRRSTIKTFQEIKIRNIEQDVKGTMVFDIVCDGSMILISNLPNNNEDYLSCIGLPLVYSLRHQRRNTNNNNAFEYIVRTKYFIINENHQEYTMNNTFVFGNIMKRNSVDDNIPNHHRNFVGVEMLTIEERNNCRIRQWCLEHIGSLVNPQDGSDVGKVTGFRYRGNHITEFHAYWSVKYYTNGRQRACGSKEVPYWELKTMLI